MNCQNFRAQIEEAIDEKYLSAATFSHLNGCLGCRAFQRDRKKLRQTLQNLPMVNAPTDFTFRVKARIKKQETNTSAVQSWRQLALLVPTALAVLIIGLVLIRGFVPQQNAQQNAKIVLPPASNAAQPSAQLPAPPDLPIALVVPQAAVNKNNDQPARRHIAAKQNYKPRVDSRKVRVLTVPSNLKRGNEEIFSRDSVVTPVKPSAMPRGIPDPLVTSRKQNGRDLLQTFGVEIASEAENFRVTSVKADSQGSKAGLEIGDLIENINGENPTAISGREFSEITLTIRRQNNMQKIKIVSKP